MGPGPWAKRKSSPFFVWTPWWNEGPVWIEQSMGKYWRNTLKTANFLRWITCPPRFGFLKTCSTRKGLRLQVLKEKTCHTRKRLVLQGKDLSYKERTWATRKRLVLQGKDLGYKEKRQDLTTIKAPTPSSYQGTHNWPLSSTLEL